MTVTDNAENGSDEDGLDAGNSWNPLSTPAEIREVEQLMEVEG